MSEVTFYRRNLPHWRIQCSCYFVTFRLHKAQPALQFEERTVVQKTLLHGEGRDYSLDAYVVMNDHVHVVVCPVALARLEDLVQQWKSVSAHHIKRSSSRNSPIWQREYFDRVIRDDREWLEKMVYISANQAKRWPGVSGYQWMRPVV